MKRPSRKAPAEQRLERLRAKVGGHVRKSKSGTPHLLVGVGGGNVASVCYFGRTNTYRIFYPYPSPFQLRYTFSTIDGAADWFKNPDTEAKE